jgi:hypothetical protein
MCNYIIEYISIKLLNSENVEILNTLLNLSDNTDVEKLNTIIQLQINIKFSEKKYLSNNYVDCAYNDTTNIECINYHIIYLDNRIIIGFSGTLSKNDVKINVNVGNDYIHYDMFKTILKFLFNNGKKLYDIINNELNTGKKKIYFCGASLGSGFAIYILIFFRYILGHEQNLYAIVVGTPPVIPKYLNNYISSYIISISHDKDPISKLSLLNKYYNLEIPNSTYFFDNDNSIKKISNNYNYSILSILTNFSKHKLSISINKTIFNNVIKAQNK